MKCFSKIFQSFPIFNNVKIIWNIKWCEHEKINFFYFYKVDIPDPIPECTTGEEEQADPSVIGTVELSTNDDQLLVQGKMF